MVYFVTAPAAPVLINEWVLSTPIFLTILICAHLVKKIGAQEAILLPNMAATFRFQGTIGPKVASVSCSSTQLCIHFLGSALGKSCFLSATH